MLDVLHECLPSGNGGKQTAARWGLKRGMWCCISIPVLCAASALDQGLHLAMRASSPCLHVRCHQILAGCDANHCALL